VVAGAAAVGIWRQLEAAFAKGGNARVTVKLDPDANHLFMKAVTGDWTRAADCQLVADGWDIQRTMAVPADR